MSKKIKGKKNTIEGFKVKSKSGYCRLVIKDHPKSQVREIGNELVELAKYILMSVGTNEIAGIKVFEAEVRSDGTTKIKRPGEEFTKDEDDCTCLKCAVEKMFKQALAETEESVSK